MGRIKKLIKGCAGNGTAFLFEKETECYTQGVYFGLVFAVRVLFGTADFYYEFVRGLCAACQGVKRQ